MILRLQDFVDAVESKFDAKIFELTSHRVEALLHKIKINRPSGYLCDIWNKDGLFVGNPFWSPIIVCFSMRTLFQCRLSVPAKAWQRVGSQVLRFCTIVPDTGQDDQRNKLSKLQQTELYELEGSKIVISTGENFSKTLILNFVLTRPLAHASFYGCELICIGLKFTLKKQSLIPKGRG